MRPKEKLEVLDRDHDITKLLHDWSIGDPQALEKLAPLVYDELHQIAEIQFGREADGHTLQPTAVVSELFLSLMDRRRVQWQDRSHFYGFAANQMRRILVSHARKSKAGKRGGGAQVLSLENVFSPVDMTPEEIVRVDEALADLAKFNPEGSRIIEMRFFGGLSRQEMAEVLGVSPSTVRDKWTAARAWLHRELKKS